jgi:uncharacterized protein
MKLIENLLVFPTWRIQSYAWEPEKLEFEPVRFASADGTQLFGWYFAHPAPQSQIVFFHGNRENVTRLGDLADFLRTRYSASVLVFDYRGYGKSEGRPSEKGITEDGHAACRWLSQRENVSPEQLILWGRSLGGGVAVDAAATFGARALILERTFAAIPDAGAHIYWWLPVRWVMQNRFDSLAKIPAYKGPLLQSHGTLDHVVPFASGRRLFEAAPSPHKVFVTLEDLGHNDPNPLEFHEARDQLFLDLGVSITSEYQPRRRTG